MLDLDGAVAEADPGHNDVENGLERIDARIRLREMGVCDTENGDIKSAAVGGWRHRSA